MYKHYKLIGGILALLFYFLLLGLLLNYFNHHHKSKAVHYSHESNKSIEVSLASPLDSKPKKKPKPKKIVKKPKKIAKKSVPKPPPPKVIKKPEPKKRSNLSTLFDKITGKKPDKRFKKKPKPKTIKIPTQRDKTINHAYFGKVEELLQNWPSQSEFAGQTIKVWLKIDNDGSFIFKILSASNNEDFNHGLIQYLQQLQDIGFDPHKNAKPYELNVEFVAKE